MQYLPAVIIVIVIAVFAVTVVLEVVKKNRKPCESEADLDSAAIEKRIKVSDRNPDHYRYCVRLTISGMTCAHCKLRVENALNAKENVWAEVNLKESTAIVRMKDELPADTLRRIVSRSGYTVEGVEKLL